MRQLKFILAISLIISCMAEEMKKHESNDAKTVHTTKDTKPAAEDPKTMKDPKSMASSDTSKSTMDHPMTVPKMTDAKSSEAAHGSNKARQGSAHGQPKDGQSPSKPKEDMEVEASAGIGFYAGVLPVSYGGYGGYGYAPYQPYYKPYYPRSYYGYPYNYRPFVPVVVKARPLPVLIG